MIEIKLKKSLSSPSGDMTVDLDLQITPGQFTALYGPSGAGKTSILRMIAGLMNPDEGHIRFQRQSLFDSHQSVNLKPQKRNLGFLFQDYALFPNMTVRQNLEFALDKGQSQQPVNDLITLMELGDLQKQKTDTLSGGQKQRVALARALVNKPDLLLLDEPLSALDREMRLKLQTYLLQVHRELNLTTLLVSHDIGEVIKMADQVLLLTEGKIIEQGSPEVVFSNAQVSGKFQFTGEVLKIELQGFVCIVSVLIGKDLVRVVADTSDIQGLEAGDQVLLASKAFNPIIKKL